MFHTPPTKPELADPITTYSDPLSHSAPAPAPQAAPPTSLPHELQSHVSAFANELQQPKYARPVTGQQLSNTFQSFYTDFKEQCDVYVKGTVNRERTKVELLTPQEITERKALQAAMDAKIRCYVQMGEDELCQSLYDKLFNKFSEDVETNEYIKSKLRLLKRVRGMDYCKFLDVNVKLTPELDELAAEFHKLGSQKAPREKLELLIAVHTSINTILLEQLNRVDGDHLLPIIIYLILVGDESDLYLDFMYIKRFRSHDLLVEDSLYCLTNLEAALMYIQTLELSDEHDLTDLTAEERTLLQTAHDMTILENKSAEGFKSALDTGIKSMMSRFSPAPEDESFNPLNRIGGLMRWRPDKTPNTASTTSTITGRVRSRTNSLQQRMRSQLSLDEPVKEYKFKGKQFEDLTVAQLREMFHDYQLLISKQ